MVVTIVKGVTAIDTISFTSLPTVAGGTVLGNPTTSVGALQAITVTGSGATFSGTTLVISGGGASITVPLVTASGGTGTNTTFSQGSIVFADVSGNYTQSNSQFFWNSTSNRLGIGTTAADAQVTINGNAASTSFVAAPAGTAIHLIGPDAAGGALCFDAFGAAPGILTRRGNNTAASPTAVVAGDSLGGIFGGGYQVTTSAFATNKAAIIMKAAENFTSAANGTIITIETTPSGSTTRAIVMTALSGGNVQFTNAANFTANNTTATLLGSVGPTSAHTTVQKWLTIQDGTGATFYVPCF